MEDVEKARELYQDILGLEITGPRNTEPPLNFERIVMGTNKRGFLELTQPNDPNSAMGKYIEKKGPGPYMVCFTTDGDMDQAVDEINKRGGGAQRDRQYGAWMHPRPNHGIFAQISNRYLMSNS